MEATLLSNLAAEDRLPFQGLPLVIVFVNDSKLPEKDIASLRNEGQSLADSLQCPFIDVCPADEVLDDRDDPDQRFKDEFVEEALRALIESIRHRSGLLNIYKTTPNNAEPDIRYDEVQYNNSVMRR